jgi:hypothetical protein
MVAGKDIHFNAQVAQGAGQLTHVNIHTPRFALSGSGQRAGVEGNEGYPFYAQLRFTTI